MKDLEGSASDLTDLSIPEELLRPPLNRDLLAHRKGAVGLLYECLRDLASKVQSSQVEEMQRVAEVSSFFSVDAPADGPRRRKPDASAWQPSEGQSAGGAPELEDESRQILLTYTSNLDKIQEMNAKIVEIGGLVNLFANKIEEQEEMITTVHDDTEKATEHIEDATKHLQRAVTNSNSYRFYVCCWFVGSALALLVFDYIDARWSWI
jgi:hypothetical protein